MLFLGILLEGNSGVQARGGLGTTRGRLQKKKTAEKECKRTVEYKTAQNEPYHLKRVKQQSAPPRAYGQKGHQKRAAETSAGERSGC